MKKLVLQLVTLVSIAIVSFAACGGTDVLPQVGAALLKARSAYVAVDRAEAKLEQIAELVCKEPPPEMVNMCADSLQALEQVDQASDEARDALILATSAYNVLNGADDSDAGAP